MTIEIHKPELEALIREGLESGAFQEAEDVLLHALRLAESHDSPAGLKAKDMVELFADSPFCGPRDGLRARPGYGS